MVLDHYPVELKEGSEREAAILQLAFNHPALKQELDVFLSQAVLSLDEEEINKAVQNIKTKKKLYAELINKIASMIRETYSTPSNYNSPSWYDVNGWSFSVDFADTPTNATNRIDQAKAKALAAQKRAQTRIEEVRDRFRSKFGAWWF